MLGTVMAQIVSTQPAEEHARREPDLGHQPVSIRLGVLNTEEHGEPAISTPANEFQSASLC